MGKLLRRRFLKVLTILGCATISSFPALLHAEQARPIVANAGPLQENKVITLSDSGLAPSTLQMKLNDSIVFFFNDTKDSDTSVEIRFNQSTMHCASSNMKIQDDGTVRSIHPFGPRTFVSTCFHEKGKYQYTIGGLTRFPQGLQGIIVVD